MRAVALVIVALLPGAALASGFHLPWWGEVLLFLLGTPAGWVCSALLLSALVAVIVIGVTHLKNKASK